MGRIVIPLCRLIFSRSSLFRSPNFPAAPFRWQDEAQFQMNTRKLPNFASKERVCASGGDRACSSVHAETARALNLVRINFYAVSTSPPERNSERGELRLVMATVTRRPKT